VASDISPAVADGDSVTTTDSTPDSVSRLTDSTTAGPVTTTDPLTAIGIQTLSQAVEMLREDVEQERDRADQAERQVRSSGNGRRRTQADRRATGLTR
jgi:hypothetical protein